MTDKEKLDAIKAFCLENLETRAHGKGYVQGYEDACEVVLKLASQ